MNLKMEITQKEIEFCKLMDIIHGHRRSVSYDEMIQAGNLVGIPINTSCRSCAQKSGVDLLNKWGQLKPAFIEWSKKQTEVMYTNFVEEVVSQVVEEQVKEIIVADELPLLEGYTEIGKTDTYKKLDQKRSEDFDNEIKSKIKKGSK